MPRTKFKYSSSLSLLRPAEDPDERSAEVNEVVLKTISIHFNTRWMGHGAC